MIGASPITILAPGVGSVALTSFTTIQTPNGTSPVAVGPHDTLTLTSTGGGVTITGNAATDTINFDVADWTITTVSTDITLADRTTYLVNTGAARNLTLPTPVSGLSFTIKDSTGTANTNNITLLRHASEKIEGLAASYIIYANWASITLVSNGTDWFII